MFKITKCIGVMKEEILRNSIYFTGTRVLDCQHEKDRKVSTKMKTKETKAEKKFNLFFVK